MAGILQHLLDGVQQNLWDTISFAKGGKGGFLGANQRQITLIRFTKSLIRVNPRSIGGIGIDNYHKSYIQ
jgi:hypothetical protein